ncbi:MAG: hypothetical protein LBI40_01535 [Treponema sp.]|jgi:hypothetical protein|nr:hypothetical protein [Treponema sp.]
MKYQRILPLFLLALLLRGGLFAQETAADDAALSTDGDFALDSSIAPEDTLVVRSADGTFDLFIRKKPDVASIMLTEFTSTAIEQDRELYGYRIDVKNQVNGGEGYIEYGSRIFKDGGIWYLVDSTPESFRFTEDGVEEQVFHIYLPPVLYYGYHDTRAGTVYAEQGLPINIRCFSASFADAHSNFTDNFFVLMLDEPKGPRLESFFIKGKEKPQPSKDISQEELPPLVAETSGTEGEEPFLLEAEVGFMYFMPGKNNGGLINTTNFPVRLFLKAPFFEKWSVNIGYEWDYILLNRLFTRAVLDLGLLNIEAGFAMGFLNFDSATMSLAFSTGLSVQSPSGRFFGSLNLDLPFDGAQKGSIFPYEQTCFSFGAGVNLPYVVISFRAFLSLMLFTEEKEIYDVSYISKQSLYALTAKTDLSGIWNFSLTVGYRELSRSVKAFLLSEPYKYSSFFVDLGGFFNVNRNFGLYLKTAVPFYPWVFNPLPTQSDAFLFSTSLGLSLRFGKP